MFYMTPEFGHLLMMCYDWMEHSVRKKGKRKKASFACPSILFLCFACPLQPSCTSWPSTPFVCLAGCSTSCGPFMHLTDFSRSHKVLLCAPSDCLTCLSMSLVVCM